ncbi:transcription factor HIVEP3 [Salminus brasiliensis]|uniref:transcription factor HIVEP3 n=1 Tax=Salminus brasiliensis TaxID=930266 RepID=UPI003B82C87D
MEAEHSRPADGERSDGQQQPLSESVLRGRLPQPQEQATSQPIHGSHGRHQYRQPKRSDMLQRQQQQQSQVRESSWQLPDVPGPSRGSYSSSSLDPSTRVSRVHKTPSQTSQEVQEGTTPRRERKPQKPGKYVCTYCGRPCAKPSVLQKHIRSHTGERPYPCVPCGFSFKTKSNLYKHRKSHAHRIKAGLASSREEHSFSGAESGTVGDEQEEATEAESTDSEDETGQRRPSTSQDRPALRKSSKVELSFSEEGPRTEDSQAVKQRLAMRLSERKRVPMTSPDETPSSSLGPGSKGSTESGYFSSYGSAELSQVSPPNANAKSYAEIILGKYGRLGQQQRIPHQQIQLSSSSSSLGQEEKSIPFTVPKTQVIEHITKLITINEAVVDTSEIDSVKPRRSSISRRSSIESPKFSSPKDPCVFDPKGDVPGPSGSTGQIILSSLAAERQHSQLVEDTLVSECSSAVLLRSQSVPSSGGQDALPSTSSHSFRLSHSFDEQQAAAVEMRVGHHHRMLRRQPAIEMPIGADLVAEAGPSTSTTLTESGWKCENCGTCLKKQDSYAAHRVSCMNKPSHEHQSEKEGSAGREDRPQMMHYKFKAMAMAVRKRRKEESLEEDPPSPGPAAVSFSIQPTASETATKSDFQGFSGPISKTDPEKMGPFKEISVIQHTSSFEKQESMSVESQESELEHEQSQEPKQTSTSKLVRQPNIQVPEILVTEEPDTEMVSPPASTCLPKELEKEEFQWPQRSQSLAQLPAEKLPPKKKRLRLAEATQSSGESSFESASLPRSPSQESNVSHTSSRSASFDEPGKTDSEMQTGTWSSQGSHMLTVPGSYQHHHSQREMRRSASEQAPASPPYPDQIVESRSKSFDYGSLSPKPTSTSWKERRKCLLVKHATLGKPDQEETPSSLQNYPVACQSYPGYPAPSIGEHRTSNISSLNPETLGKTLQLFQSPLPFPTTVYPLTSSETFSPRQLTRFLPVTTTISDVISTHMFQQALMHAGPSPLHPRQIHLAERLVLPLQPFPTLLPLQYSTSGLTIQVPSGSPVRESRSSPFSVHGPSYHQLVPHQQPQPIIATCLEQFTPVVSLVVPVRLQTHIPTYASAMYTTISQILETTRSQQPICCTAMVIMGKLESSKLQRSYLRLPTPDLKTCIPMSLPLEFGSESTSDESSGPLVAGGNKRMLSPAGSLELTLEAQRHQKRVKEEEEQEEKREDEDKSGEKSLAGGQGTDTERITVGLEWRKEQEKEVKKTDDLKESLGSKLETVQVEPGPFKKEEKQEEGHKCPSVVEVTERSRDPLYPSLHTTTSVSWCYLNYTKPNPSAQRNPQTSVYSSWSVSMYNPNLPGLSTKVVLSLLCSKQTYSSEMYTMATAPPLSTEKLVPASNEKPMVSEVCAKPPNTTDKVKDEPVSKSGEKEEQSTEEAATTSKQSEPPRICIFEGGYKSNEEYVYVRGRGRGKYVCGECGIRCKKPSMLKKHIRTHTDIRPYVCKHCNFAFKTKGNLTKHMKSKAHGKKCQEIGVSESSIDELDAEEAGTSEEQVCESEDQDEHQFSDAEDTEDEDEDDDNEEEDDEASSHEEPSSCSTDTRHSDSCQGSQADPPTPTAPDREDHPSPCRPWSSGSTASPGSKRALFSHKAWELSPRAFSPGSEGSPLRSLSPRLELSSPSRHLSPSPERGPSPLRASPVRPLSPLRPLSPARYRSSRAHFSPTPLRPQHRPHSSPAQFHWDSNTQTRESQQEKLGTPGAPQAPQRLSSPNPSLLPPALRLSHTDPFPHLPVTPRTMDRMFSHLPLHSQDQARMPYHMIPIGGIQMVQLRPRTCPKLERSSSSNPSPTSPKEDSPFSLSRQVTSWSSHPETSQHSSLAVSETQSMDRGARPAGMEVPASSSSSAKSSPQHSNEDQREKDRKLYGSSRPSKTRAIVHQTSQEVGQDNSKGTKKTPVFAKKEEKASSHRTKKLSELDAPKEGPSKRHNSKTEGTAGEKSACPGQSPDSKPDST